jgi:L-ribulose-5-phosphate 3-epimerase
LHFLGKGAAKVTTLKLGVIVGFNGDAFTPLKKVADLGLPTCQLSCWNVDVLTPENAKKVKEASEELGVQITTVWTGWPGPTAWNFTEGPLTLGLVPPVYRYVRVEALKRGSDFAKIIGAPGITTHVGFIPENSSDPNYPGLIVSLKEITNYCRANGQFFAFETGQETPVTLLRAIEDIGTDNLGINLDPANLILYGKANPVDALDVFGKYVIGLHAKDGLYPINGRELGKEVPLGEGKVNFPVLIPKLKECGYKGAVTIEREIGGPQQIADINKAVKLLTPLLY